ncbi:MAG: hypothetical protein H7Y22_12120 [Gemmatimonadaceae bacterium]|nr:hypothetical protein [Gloeobacterales cyanobacterium ES-bin-141]
MSISDAQACEHITLENLLTSSEYRVVKTIASGRKAIEHLPVVAWMLGFLSTEQLGLLL